MKSFNNLRELVIGQLDFHETAPVPYARLGFEEGIAKKLDGYYGSDTWRKNLRNAIISAGGLKIKERVSDLYVDDYGTVWRYGTGAMHIESPALAEPTLKNLILPDPEKLCPDEHLEQVNRNAANYRHLFTMMGFGFGLFEKTWALRGFENALLDIAAEPAFYADLVATIAEHQQAIIGRLLQTRIDGVYFSDDWGDQRGVIIGADRWRQVFKPHLSKMYAQVHAAGKYALSHCCGNVREIIPDCIEIGLDCLQSVQPEAVDPYALKKEFNGKIAFWGGLGSQSLIPFGTPLQIEQEVTKLRREMAKGGGYILGPAKDILNDTPLENAVAVVEAFNADAY